VSDQQPVVHVHPPAPATVRKRANTRPAQAPAHATQRDREGTSPPQETTNASDPLTGETNAQRDPSGPRPHRPPLTDAEREAIHAAIDALPPMTDEQIDALAEVIIAARERRRHTRQTSRGPPATPGHDTHSPASDPDTGRWPAIM